MSLIRVLVADDHPTFRTGLRAVLSAAPGVEVIGEAVDGYEAVDQASALRPDVVVMDLRMPGIDGVEACRRIVRGGLARVIMLTMSSHDDALFKSLQAGALGYLVKDASAEEIVSAVRAAARGAALISASVAEHLPLYADAPPATERAFPGLTPREIEILRHLAAGEDDTTIARRLTLSTKTVRNYVSNILAKLPARDRAQAVARARDVGLGKPPDESA